MDFGTVIPSSQMLLNGGAFTLSELISIHLYCFCRLNNIY
jgi:hypothetical protein